MLDSVVKNHPLVDGNKRLGRLACAVFPDINGVDPTAASNDDVYELVMDVDAHAVQVDELTQRQRSTLGANGLIGRTIKPRSPDCASTVGWHVRELPAGHLAPRGWPPVPQAAEQVAGSCWSELLRNGSSELDQQFAGREDEWTATEGTSVRRGNYPVSARDDDGKHHSEEADRHDVTGCSGLLLDRPPDGLHDFFVKHGRMMPSLDEDTVGPGDPW